MFISISTYESIVFHDSLSKMRNIECLKSALTEGDGLQAILFHSLVCLVPHCLLSTSKKQIAEYFIAPVFQNNKQVIWLASNHGQQLSYPTSVRGKHSPYKHALPPLNLRFHKTKLLATFPSHHLSLVSAPLQRHGRTTICTSHCQICKVIQEKELPLK